MHGNARPRSGVRVWDRVMHITHLHIRDLRCLGDVELRPVAGLNLVTGDNGAGKTSVLEALHLLAWGRSFRGRVRDGLVRSGQPALEVFARWQDDSAGRERRVGLRHDGQRWEGRLDGQAATQLGELCAALAVVTFEPGSHALVDGPAEVRRRFLDWGLFHVEQDFQSLWRRHQRALKQRNALLKQRGGSSQLDAWDQELAAVGEALTRARESYLARLQAPLQAIGQQLSPGLGVPHLHYRPGWRREQMQLADALLLARDRDRDSGFTSVGAHRADWRLGHGARPADEPLSRGQAKLTALACILAQATDFATSQRQWPVILLDDLASELDLRHQQRLLAWLAECGAQVVISGTQAPPMLHDLGRPVRRFHVEHGQVRDRGDA